MPQPARVYNLDEPGLSEEQIAVTFAMTSRRPEPFDETARQVSETQAADFHERWVVGYGHASVAEHAIIHLAAEHISRIAADALEDGRLASYTEKSSRYQIIPADDFHTPEELPPELRERFQKTCQLLFRIYHSLLPRAVEHVKRENPGRAEIHYRRAAADACRAILPAATLTNVGLTANARALERSITRLMSDPLAELRQLGEELRREGRKTAPTLVKYADANRLEQTRRSARPAPATGQETPRAALAGHDPDAENKAVAALIYRNSGKDYAEARRQAERMLLGEKATFLVRHLADMDEHDQPPREFETILWQFELVMDYGALREFRRHRMMTHITQPLTANLGLNTPALLTEAGLAEPYAQAAGQAAELHQAIAAEVPHAAAYAVTHGHLQRTLATANLRELWHIFRLRTSPQAHPDLRRTMQQALELARKAHPILFQGMKLR